MTSGTDFIRKNYGSKKGLLRLVKFSTQQSFFGTFSKYKELPASTDRVVFVCKGNICRSPLAEEVFRNSSTIEVVSLGLDTQSGHPAHPPIVKASLCQGYDLSNHVTTFVGSFSPEDNDLYVCTEPAHIVQLQTVIETQRILLLGLFGSPVRVYIHDPYSAPDEYTANTVDYIISATQNLATALKVIEQPFSTAIA